MGFLSSIGKGIVKGIGGTVGRAIGGGIVDIAGGLIGELLCKQNETQGVMADISKHIRTFEDDAMAPMRDILGLIGPGVWEGDGANKFADEVNRELLSIAEDVLGQVTGLNGNISSSLDNIISADNSGKNKIESLIGDVFASIF